MSPRIYTAPCVNVELLHQDLYDRVLHDRALANKFLYLGWQGAKGWLRVDHTYKIGAQGKRLLELHYANIDDLLRSHFLQVNPDSRDGTYDIVSLGCGSGEDDTIILDTINRKLLGVPKPNPFNVITVDLSYDLLGHGSELIKEHLANSTRISKSVGVWPVYCDIESLSAAKPYISDVGRENQARRNPNALYHLLGLTLGNNQEVQFLKAISAAMNVGDCLLLGIDFSAEDEKVLKVCEDAYSRGSSREPIDEFLSGPLLWAIKFRSVSSGGVHPHLVEEDSPLQNSKLAIIHAREHAGWEAASNVKGTVSLVRYHKWITSDRESNVPRLCDYSHKYTISGLTSFLEELHKTSGVPLTLVGGIGDYPYVPTDEESNKKKPVPMQHLVLLKRVKLDIFWGLPDRERKAAAENWLTPHRDLLLEIQQSRKKILVTYADGSKKMIEVADLLQIVDPSDTKNIEYALMEAEQLLVGPPQLPWKDEQLLQQKLSEYAQWLVTYNKNRKK